MRRELQAHRQRERRAALATSDRIPAPVHRRKRRRARRVHARARALQPERKRHPPRRRRHIVTRHRVHRAARLGWLCERPVGPFNAEKYASVPTHELKAPVRRRMK